MKALLRSAIAITSVLSLGVYSQAQGQLHNAGVWTSPPEDYSVAAARAGANNESVKARWDVLKSNPHHPSAPRLFAFLGQELYGQGYFSDAIECFKLGWETYKEETDHDTKMFADLCGAELAQMYARIGRMEDLQRFLKETEKRDFIGQATALIDNSYSGLWGMQNMPQTSFKCGPFALRSLLPHFKDEVNSNALEVIEKADSQRTGFSLSDVASLSRQMGLNFQICQREPGAAVIVPSVIHWNLDHFAAIVEKDGNKYKVVDPTFGRAMWVTEDAIDKEGSGYFLIPPQIYKGYSSIDQNVARQVRGKGFTGGPAKGAANCPTTAGGNADSCVTCAGMPEYTFALMPAALRLVDTPVFYTPPYGPKMDFTLTYNQRDEYDRVMYNISNFGHQWGFKWFEHIEYDTATGYLDYAAGGGGGVMYEIPSGAGNVYAAEKVSYGVTPLNMDVGATPSSSRTLPDGSVQEFKHIVPITGTKKLMLLTKFTDPYGQSVTINYNSTTHLVETIVDAAGLTTTFCYDENGLGHCLSLVKSITDPYGRTAYFNYDASYRLIQITDILGLVTTFTYSGNGSFIEKMTTPYGDTHFEREDTDANTPQFRYIQATDPEGGIERAEYRDSTTLGDVYPSNEEFPDFTLMQGGGSEYFNFRNTFFWSKKAMQEAPNELASAKIYHWLHSNGGNWGGMASRLLEAVKEPLEGPFYYWYPGQSNARYEGDFYNPSVNTGSSPSQVARRLDSGETQIYTIEYNEHGKATRVVDPLGRDSKLDYDTSGFFPVTQHQKISGNYTTVSLTAYDTKNRPIKYTEPSGGETAITYHSDRNLPLTVTNALNETVILDYTTTGLLKRISQPDNSNYVEFAYGAYDQVTSVTRFPEKYTINYEYDKFNRLTKTIYPDGTSEKYVYEKLDLVAERDRLNQWTNFSYNANRKLKTKTNPALEKIEYLYCDCGALDGFVDAEGRITTYNYDIQGRMTSTTLPGSAPKEFQYELLSGRRTVTIDAKGQRHCLAYNRDNSVSGKWVENIAAGTHAATPTYYDWDSDILRVAAWGDSISTTTLTYVPYNGLVSTNPGAGLLSGTDSIRDMDDFFYEYDLLGRMINSSEGSITYDNLGRITEIVNALDTFTYSFIPHSYHPAGVSSTEGGYTSYAYENNMGDFKLHSITHRDNANNVKQVYLYNTDKLNRITGWYRENSVIGGKWYWATYDKSNRMTDLYDEDFNSTNHTNEHWNFNKTGSRINYQHSSYISGFESTTRIQYAVNEKDQVTTSISGGPVYVSGYTDRPGTVTSSYPYNYKPTESNKFQAWINTDSLTSATIYAADYSANTTQQAVSISAVGTPSYESEYDENGNMTRKTTTERDGITTYDVLYEWDANDRLVSITSGTQVTEIVYDGKGRRYSVVDYVNGSLINSVYFLWDGLRIAGFSEKENLNELTICFSHGYESGGKSYYYRKDHLGSIREVFRGVSSTLYEYSSYGKPKAINGNLSSPFLYTGHYYHESSGLYFAPFREYDPELGRWLSPEPLGLDGPNLYHYVYNSPISAVDLTGLHIEKPKNFGPWWNPWHDSDGDGVDDKDDQFPHNPMLPADAPNAKRPSWAEDPPKQPYWECMDKCMDKAFPDNNVQGTALCLVGVVVPPIGIGYAGGVALWLRQCMLACNQYPPLNAVGLPGPGPSIF